MNLNQVTLLVKDFETSIAFYQSLGFTMIVYSPDNQYARFETIPMADEAPGSFSLHAGLTEDVNRYEKHSAASLYFECASKDALNAKYKSLTDQQIITDHPPTDQSWGWTEFWLSDPNGHHLCFYYAGAFRLNPPWRV